MQARHALLSLVVACGGPLAPPTVAVMVPTQPIGAHAASRSERQGGDEVDVEWGGSFYPARIVAVHGQDLYLVHYEGYSDDWDEEVGADRIRGRTNSPVPLVPPAPEDETKDDEVP
jgi:hypothetical protein